VDSTSIARVIQEDLGGPPEELFAEWSPTPFAAASIGQVHAARHHDGRALAVKVQYEGIQEAIENDLRNVQVMNTLGGLLFPDLDREGIMKELHDRILEECDYRKEAQNQEEFRTLYRDREGIAVPRVVPELSSRRVLTAEHATGLRFNAFAERASQEQRNRAGEAMMTFAYESILAHDMFNCDPHPGNYLFTERDVVFLDFGSVKRFDPAFVDLWREMLRSVVDKDRRRFEETVVALGIAPHLRGGFDFEYQLRIAEYLSLPWLEDARFRFDQGYIQKSFDVMLFDNPNKFKMNLPPNLVFLNRLQWGLYAVLSTLGSEANFRRIMEPLLEPRAPIGAS
jgi:predicted unusual protein kinase regulating ubiquinone biosynthesis (AarF/ABC1/UbiB family)